MRKGKNIENRIKELKRRRELFKTPFTVSLIITENGQLGKYLFLAACFNSPLERGWGVLMTERMI